MLSLIHIFQVIKIDSHVKLEKSDHFRLLTLSNPVVLNQARESVYPGPSYLGKDRKTNWSMPLSSSTEHTKRLSIVIHLPGSKARKPVSIPEPGEHINK